MVHNRDKIGYRARFQSWIRTLSSLIRNSAHQSISGKLLFGVGTPSRIQKLMEAGVLNPQSVFLDYNYRNKKRQRLIDEKEVKKQLAEFFGAFVETQKQTDTKLFIF